jgi:ornithine carbamoyltransferase
MQTIKEHLGGWSGHKLTYVGNSNNMVHSLLLAGSLVGLDICVATPPHSTPDPAVIRRAKTIAAETGSTITLVGDPVEGVRGADIVYTDVWVSMGQELTEEMLTTLKTYQVTSELMATAGPNALFMHCLPMYRGQEATAEVADGPRSVIFDQAENRLHMHKALLVELLANPSDGVLR